MGAYKKLNKQDAYITTHTAHKTWAIPVDEFAQHGILSASAEGGYLNSLQQLYYPSKSNGEIISHSYDYYNQTTLNFPQSRNLVTGSYVLSIPRDMYGVSIQPGLVVHLSDGIIDYYVSGAYWNDDYTDDAIRRFSAPLYTFPEYFEDDYIDESLVQINLRVTDDGEGNLYIVDSNPRRYVGDVIYSHGMLVFTDINLVKMFQSKPIDNITYKTSHPIFTHTYHCRVRESELNHTYNPSALSSSLKTLYTNTGDIYSISASYSDGDKNANVSVEQFQPYITTVGLYNDANQLIAVGKMAQPIPKSANTEMTITVKIDI